MPQHIKSKSGTRKHKHIKPVKNGALIRQWCKWGFCKMIDLADQRTIAGAQPVPEAFSLPFFFSLLHVSNPVVVVGWFCSRVLLYSLYDDHFKPISQLSHRDIDTRMWEPSQIKGLASKLTHFEENTQHAFSRVPHCALTVIASWHVKLFFFYYLTVFERPSDSGHVSHGKLDFRRAKMGV